MNESNHPMLKQNEQIVKIQYLDTYDKEWGELKYAKDGDAGFDLRAVKNLRLLSNPMANRDIVPTGIKLEIPEGYQLEIRPRSGLAAKNGLIVVNSPGTIDSGYRGEICVILMNLGSKDFQIERGDRIAQGVLMPYYKAVFVEVDEVSTTERGSGGCGSTGVKLNEKGEKV